MTNSGVAEAVVVERTFNAPVARIWRALTTVEELRAWYFCDAEAYDGFELKEFKPEVGFEFEFITEHEGNSYHHLYQVTEVIPQRKLAYTWRFKGEPEPTLFSVSAKLKRLGVDEWEPSVKKLVRCRPARTLKVRGHIKEEI